LVKLGIAIGLALGVRVGGLLFLCYLGLLLVLSAGWQAVIARRLSVAIAAGWTSLWRVLLPVAALAFAVMLVFWPPAQRSPILNPLRALASLQCPALHPRRHRPAGRRRLPPPLCQLLEYRAVPDHGVDPQADVLRKGRNQ
jgi:hypothetical protein